MPTYSFNCKSCDKNWDTFLTMENRDNPTKEKCPHCLKKSVERCWMGGSMSIQSDTTLTPNKATGGQWNELMAKMKSGLPGRYARKLDTVNNMSGRSWKG